MATPAPEYERFNPCADASSQGVLWRSWLRGVELMAESKCISVAPRKRALLLYYAGTDVEDIYFSLSTECHLQPLQQSSTLGPSADDEYVRTVRLLNRHFAAEVNTPYERYKLSEMYEGESETVDEYVTRLRQQIQNTGWTCRQSDEAGLRINPQMGAG
jgi:hypothetical protein